MREIVEMAYEELHIEDHFISVQLPQTNDHVN